MLLCVNVVNAQSIGVAISAGSYTSNFRIKGNSSAIENQTGYQTGLSVAIKAPFLSVTPEVWYSHSSFKLNDASILGAKAKVKTNTVQMPVLVGYSLLGPLKLEVGPRFTLVDKAYAKFYSGDKSRQEIGSVMSKVGYTAGAKLTVMRKIILSARYNGQFGGRDNEIGDEVYDIRNSSYSFSVGFKL